MRLILGFIIALSTGFIAVGMQPNLLQICQMNLNNVGEVEGMLLDPANTVGLDYFDVLSLDAQAKTQRVRFDCWIREHGLPNIQGLIDILRFNDKDYMGLALIEEMLFTLGADCLNLINLPFSLKKHLLKNKLEKLVTKKKKEPVSVSQSSISRLPGEPFPSPEYNHYMSIIQDISVPLHNQLVECGKQYGTPCLRQGDRNIVPNKYIVIPSFYIPGVTTTSYGWRDNLIRVLREYAPHDSSLLKDTMEEQRRLEILGLLKELAPDLYGKIVAVDPLGMQHIILENGEKIEVGNINASNHKSLGDGLPVIGVKESFFILLTKEEKLFVIGHELGHYVAGDPYDREHFDPVIFNMDLNNDSGSGLPFSKTFNLAQGRQQEFDADRFAVLNLGVNPESGINFLNTVGAVASNKPTFEATHPLGKDRIKNLEQINYDLRQVPQVPMPQINWDKVIAEHQSLAKI